MRLERRVGQRAEELHLARRGVESEHLSDKFFHDAKRLRAERNTCTRPAPGGGAGAGAQRAS